MPAPDRPKARPASRFHRKTLQPQRTFFVEGVRNFVLAVDMGFEIKRLFFSDKLLINPLARKLLRQCRRAGVDTRALQPEGFRALSSAKRASGIAALLGERWIDLPDTARQDGQFWTLLDTVRSPGNLGTLIRSSHALGGAGFILAGNRIDPYDPDTVRASMGAVFRQHFVRTDWNTLRQHITKTGWPVIAASPKGTETLPNLADRHPPLLLTFGEERKGLSSEQSALATHLLRIPMHSDADSLNLGVAGSLVMYEIRRNQTPSPG